MVIVTCDEEAGATIGAKWLCENVPEKVRCDWVVNEGAGEVLDFGGRRFYTLCVGEKGVFRFTLTTEGRAGHASMPRIGDNALLRMVDGARPPGRPPAAPSTRYPEAEACLERPAGASGGRSGRGPGGDPLDREPGSADLIEPMLGVTIAPTMIRGLREGERDPVPLLGPGRLPGAARFR